MSLINFPNKFDKISIVCYPAGTGGNFLINCLSLSNDCVFLDAGLARLQLEGKFTVADKINYLKTKLQESRTNGVWNDLSLGNQNYFGVDRLEWLTSFPEILYSKLDPIVKHTINNNKNFFFILHEIVNLDRIKEFWPNSKIILFDNYRNFLQKRYKTKSTPSSKLVDYWNIVRDSSWPMNPPQNKKEFESLPKHCQDELIDVFSFEISRWFDHSVEFDLLWSDAISEAKEKYNQDVAVWDVDQSYKDSQALVSNLDFLFDCLDLPVVDSSIIEDYFYDWKNTLECIRSRSNKI